MYLQSPFNPCHRLASLLATCGVWLALSLSLTAQLYVDPADALGIWEFNNSAVATQSTDLIYGTPLVFQGGAAFSADAGGRSSMTGDRAVNFGTTAGRSARVTDPAFLGLLNLNNQTKDQLSVVFWIKWSSSVTQNSAVWFTSASASDGNRGFQAHVPWIDGNLYFDTSGCSNPAQRLSGAVSGVNWQQWNHITLIKSGGVKQVWINGQLRLSQASGASPLLNDWTLLTLGAQPGTTNSVRGLIDDFALFGTTLSQAQIASLAGGSSPTSLILPPEQRPPSISDLVPANGSSFHPVGGGTGFTASTFAPNSLPTEGVKLFVNGVNETENLSITGSPTQRVVTYTAPLIADRYYSMRAEVTDSAARVSSTTWTFDTADPAVTPLHQALDLPALGTARMSGTGNAAVAIDASVATFAETPDQAGSFWEIEMNRAVVVSRIALTTPTGAAYAGALDGAVVRLYNLEDQLVYEAAIPQLVAGQTWMFFPPAGVAARVARIELPAGQTNGAGNHRLALADVKLYGDPSPEYGPLALTSIGTVSQSTTNGSNTAALAIDGNAATLSETSNAAGGYWLLKLDRARDIERVEVVNRTDSYAARLSGLTLRILDDALNTLATATLTNPGSGATWGFTLPPGTANARYVRIGLENGAVNGYGDQVVSLAGVSLFSSTNLALNTPSYMVRLTETLPAPSLANDGNHSTHSETTDKTVDGWWETDLGSARALYCVRAVAYDSGTDQARLTHATLRLFDENHNSVYAVKLTGTSAVFDIALPGPVNARYVRVGFENKERSTADGSIGWYLRLREVQAFGRPSQEAGLTGFAATSTAITAGGSSTLTWTLDDLRELTLYPPGSSLGAYATPAGSGSFTVSPAATTEYTIVGRDAFGSTPRHLTITVNGQALPPRISEFCADNRLSLRDGYADASDWIELRNPNNFALDIGGYWLSDNPAQPMKWQVPAGVSIPAHGTWVVIASGRDIGPDASGYFHTNFGLNSAGESLVLTEPNGTSPADAVLNFPPQGEDLAYGLGADGTLTFLAPTPGAFNLTTNYSGHLAPPLFSHSRGFHEAPFSLTLTNPNPDSELLYSLNGSDPATVYAGPIAITSSTTVRATVRRAGFQSPPLQTHTYLFKNSVMTSPLMNTTYTQGALSTRLRASLAQLPTICLSVPQLPDDRIERSASIEVFMPDGSAPVQVNAGLNRVGGSWTDFAKRSYRVSFRAEYGSRNLEVPLFRGFDRGIPAKDRIDTLDLSAGNHDMVDRGFYMGNRFVEDTMLEMGSLNPHGRFVHVYVNGVYWGQYNAHERMEDSFLAAYLGGSNSDYVNVMGNDNVGDAFVPGTPEPPNRDLWESAHANRSSYLAVKDRVDLSQMIDFMLCWYYGNCESEYRCAGPIAPGSGFKFWSADADGFLGSTSTNINLNRSTNTGPAGIFGALTTEGHADFKTLLADRIYRHFHNNGALTQSRNLARLNARMSEVQDSMIAECARWNYRTPDNWLSAAESVRTALFPVRSTTVLNQMKTRGYYPSIDPPTLSKFGGSVPQGYQLSITSGTGTVYYTLDGSDPRLAGGNTAPGVLSAPGGTAFTVTLTQNTKFKARLRNGTVWSALADTSFQIAHPLIAAGPYVFSTWSPTALPGTYPSAMRFYQTDLVDPVLATAMDTPWTLGYDFASRSRINGLDTDGIGFLNTGSVQTAAGAGFVGAAVLALDTTGAQDIQVMWTGGTVMPNERDYGIRLQYRVGGTGSFVDLSSPGGTPVEYLRNPMAGHSQVIGPFTLPVTAENQALVELRWKYYFRSGTTGARAQLRLGNIQVAAGPVVAESLAFTGTPLGAQAGAASGPVTVEVRGRNGALATAYNGTVTLAATGYAGTLAGTLSRAAVQGVVVFDDLVFSAPGAPYLTANAAGLTGATALLPVRVAGLTAQIMPHFIQGAAPTNNDRVPFACLLQITGLLPNSTYRYAPQFVSNSDSPTAEGAGNILLVGSPFVRCTASPRFLAGDLNLRHGEFVTDANGAHTGWFALEPTGNERFTPGAEGRIRLLLNDGGGGDFPAHYLTSNVPVHVLGFGSAADQGSAVFGETAAAPRRFLVFYDNVTGDGSPLAATPVEATGIAADPSLAPFYQAEVAGQADRWGTILPNNLTSCIRRVEERDGSTGALLSVYAPAGGITATAGLAGGTSAIGLRIPAAGESLFRQWLAARFVLAQLNDPTLGGPQGDPDRDRITNLVEFAFGLDPWQASGSGLPTLRRGSGYSFVFRYQRPLGATGLDYRIEHSTGLDAWTDAEPLWAGPEQTSPNPDGLTETISRTHIPDTPTKTHFFRVKVTEP